MALSSEPIAPGAFALESFDFDDFHERELPRRLAFGHAELAAPELARLPVLAIRIAESGAAVTYRPVGEGVEILRGDAHAEIGVEISLESFAGLASDVETPPGLIYGGRVKCLRGDMMHFVAWEPALRAMFHGRPIYRPEQVQLKDRFGAPLDLTRGFALDDDREEMAHFLRTAGYLLVKDVFVASEIDAFRRGADALRERAVEGDQKSWWGRNEAGESVLCRVIDAGALAVFRDMPREPRLLALAALADAEMVPGSAGEVDGVTVLWKNPRMSEGLSDLPWHRDCGMGGHATMCPTMVCSTFLEANTPEQGALRFLPGSWQASYGFREATDSSAPAGVLPPAEPGDVTLHYGDGMHVAPPPTGESGPFRCAVLTSFSVKGARHHRGERHYNDVLLGSEDGQVAHMAEMARRT